MAAGHCKNHLVRITVRGPGSASTRRLRALARGPHRMPERASRLRARTLSGPERAPATAGGRHSRRRYHGQRGGPSAEQESILELQRLAGSCSQCCRPGLASVRSVADGGRLHPARPQAGRAGGWPPSIRACKGGAGILGLTLRGIERRAAAVQAGAAWSRARPGGPLTAPDRLGPEPILEEYWPTKGRHKIADHTFVDIDDEWEERPRRARTNTAAMLAWPGS